jgi:alpha-methylacyl-CoA racemase
VLTFGEAGTHPHVRQRSTLIEVDGVVQAAPAPRFSRTPAGRPASPADPGAHTAAVFAEWLATPTQPSARTP